MADRVAGAMDSEGKWHPPYTWPGSDRVKPKGVWFAADDLYVTVEAYARLLISIMNDDALSPHLARERLRVHREVDGTRYWTCLAQPASICPDPYGYGLGWTIFGYGEDTIVQHGGNDFGEHAFVYYYPRTRDGVIVFIIGGNGFHISMDIIDLIDEKQLLSKHFRALIAAYLADRERASPESRQ